MSDPKDHNPQVAGIYRAMALRFYSRYAEARDHAEGHGGDLSGYGSRPTQRDADERYAAAVEPGIEPVLVDEARQTDPPIALAAMALDFEQSILPTSSTSVVEPRLLI